MKEISLSELTNEFKIWLMSEGITQETVRNFVSQFREFSRFCDNHQIKASALDVTVSRAYLAWLTERPNYHNGKHLSSSYRLKHYYCLGRIGNFLREKGIIQGSLIEGIRKPVPRKTVIQGFSAEQLNALINEVRQTRAAIRYKDRMSLLVYLLASTGLRINEALNLRVNSIDHTRRVMLVIGKGDKEREVPFPNELSELILHYIRKYAINRDEFLFSSRYGRPLASSTIRDALRRAGKSLGTNFNMDTIRVSPHTLRHTFARLWVIKGGNTIALSRIMGHTSTQMTSEYVRLWGVDLNEAYNNCSPCSEIIVPKID